MKLTTAIFAAAPLLVCSHVHAAPWNYVFCVTTSGRWNWLEAKNVTDAMKNHGANIYKETAYYYGQWVGDSFWPVDWKASEVGQRCAEVEAACRAQLGEDIVRAQASSGSHNQFWRQLGNCKYYKVE
ncbi:hypothetical protein WME73_39190 [Sorangium sp. So ce302]|uniref:hypothetical protein n=1 Tax=Sorangium sp. So ce302 TaxID=3133297 RepID=UPI003F5E642C